MNDEELAVLGRYVKALCPAQKFDEYTPDAWLMVLGGFEFKDCKAVLPKIAQGRPFIAPSDIATAVKELRSKRLDAANVIYEPHPEETVSDFLARARGVAQAAASGQLPASRPTLALPSGGPAFVPPSIANVVQQVREARNTKHPALAVACPWEACKAQPGSWCSRRGVGGRTPKTVPGFVHPTRCDAVGYRFTPNVPESTAEERASRELARARAAKEAPPRAADDRVETAQNTPTEEMTRD